MTQSKTRKATTAASATTLEAIPNIGTSLADDLRSIGIKEPRELIGRDPHALYLALCKRTRSRQDPCVLDTFISAVRFMEGASARPWWRYTAERKKRFPALAFPARASRPARVA
ncbi:MAG TPA: helix-hairpin-helix domain-containing protein [Chthoniobacterales bacterium]|jgi:hypothetical protein